MSGSNVHQANEVSARINKTAETDPGVSVLRNHVNDIANELAEANEFAYIDDRWILSEREWDDWRKNGGEAKYRR